MTTLFPVGLSEETFQMLLSCVEEVEHLSPQELLKRTEKHLNNAHIAYKKNPLVNIELADAIVECFRDVVQSWDSIPDHARQYCKGMMHYFVISDDELKDFSSPIGFDDDAEVMNACLRVAGLDKLCVNPEECN